MLCNFYILYRKTKANQNTHKELVIGFGMLKIDKLYSYACFESVSE